MILRSFTIFIIFSGIHFSDGLNLNLPTSSSSQLRPSNRATNIDELRLRYLTLEHALWQILPTGLDQRFILDQIHKTHKTFLTENFGERGIQLSLYDRPQLLLYDDIVHINLTINVLTETYLDRTTDKINERQMIEFVKNGINFTQTLNRIYDLTNNQEFFQKMVSQYGTNQCNRNASVIISNNQLLYNYYNDIAAAQLKAYLLVQLSYMLYTAYGFGDYHYISQTLRISFKKQCIDIQEHVQPLMRTAKQEVWMCDPNDYKGNYEEVTRLLQGYIDNEVNFNTKNNCKKTCSDYTLTENNLCYNGTLCNLGENNSTKEDLKCKGTILNCDFIGSDMDVCLTEPHQYYTTNRRYEYIKYDNGKLLGKEKLCNRDLTRVESWRRWLVHCSQCFCYCDEPSTMSDRYFSLRDVVSNINQNMIVTGVSIRKYNQVFHLKIAERKLWRYGVVNVTYPSWTAWKHGNYFKVNDNGVHEGVDYHKLSWQNRSINMDVIRAPAGYLVTGVRFQIHQGVINLEIRVTKFNFTSGELLDKANSFWMASMNKYADRIEIKLLQPDISILTPNKSLMDREENKFVNFQPTDMLMDAGQTTVPFIDIQSVEPKCPVPLTGVGIYFKGQPFYGGFIGPKLIVYDYSEHVYSPENA